jgi:hypothetical protein
MPELEPDGTPVIIGDVEVVSPGLTGTVEVHYPGASGLRGPEDASDLLLAALDAAGMQSQLTVEITDQAEQPEAASSPTRSTSRGEAGLTLTVPGPGTGMGQVLLAADESGTLSWVLPDDLPAPEAATRGADWRSYTVPRSVAAGESTGSRGLVGAIGKKVLKVLAFRLLATIAGAAAQHFAAQWEHAHHQYRLRDFTPQTYASPQVPSLTAGDLSGPALLLIHDAMNLTHSGFGRLPAPAVADLHTRYGGRVFGFDHPTLSVSPTENARRLAELTQGANLEVDILAHGRGGLVARVLSEHSRATGLTGIAVRRLVMVGTPNAGTRLADFEHLGDLVDNVTNVLDLFPDVGITDVLSTVISVVKQLAVGALTGLDGLTAMQPDGDYLRWLNQPGRDAAAYFAVASGYEPPPDTPLSRLARTRLTGAVFAGAANDLVVPQEGVSAANGATPFPVAESVTLTGDRSVDHFSYWSSPHVQAQLRTWLQAG